MISCGYKIVRGHKTILLIIRYIQLMVTRLVMAMRDLMCGHEIISQGYEMVNAWPQEIISHGHDIVNSGATRYSLQSFPC